jgi:hypothetical protein
MHVIHVRRPRPGGELPLFTGEYENWLCLNCLSFSAHFKGNQLIAWDPGVVGRKLRLVTPRLNIWNEIYLFYSCL